MNYSKTIREYCMQNPGMIFDMSYEHKKHFEKSVRNSTEVLQA